jgi:Protein of unknown function (DUF3311)
MAYDAPGEERFTRQQEPRDGAATTRKRGVAVHDRNHGWYWLFAIPFVFTLLPWIYNKSSPELFGIPFFYWYQMAWVPITVVLTIIVYIKTKGA